MKLLPILTTASLLFLAACSRQVPDQPGFSALTSHSEEPIIIDNPKAFIGFLRNLTEVGEVVGPIYDEVTIILDHKPLRFLRLDKTSAPVELGDSKVILTFRGNLGSLVIDHAGDEPGAIVISPGDVNATGAAPVSKLKWKRQHQDPANPSSQLGIFAKNTADTYEVESIDYQPKSGPRVSHPFPQGPVHIRLCVDTTPAHCPQ